MDMEEHSTEELAAIVRDAGEAWDTLVHDALVELAERAAVASLEWWPGGGEVPDDPELKPYLAAIEEALGVDLGTR